MRTGNTIKVEEFCLVMTSERKAHRTDTDNLKGERDTLTIIHGDFSMPPSLVMEEVDESQ